MIQRAGLVVPVDSEVPRHLLVDDQHNAQLELGIHGGGPKYNAANRWFDKLGVSLKCIRLFGEVSTAGY